MLLNLTSFIWPSSIQALPRVLFFNVLSTRHPHQSCHVSCPVCLYILDICISSMAFLHFSQVFHSTCLHLLVHFFILVCICLGIVAGKVSVLLIWSFCLPARPIYSLILRNAAVSRCAILWMLGSSLIVLSVS